MKSIVSTFSILVLFGALVVGCGSDEPRQATEGASADAIAEYEAAVAEAEGSMEESAEAMAEEDGAEEEE